MLVETLDVHIETDINTEVLLFKNTFEGKTDYRVRMKDLDANKVVDGIRIFTIFDKAKEYFEGLKNSLNPNYIHKNLSIPV